MFTASLITVQEPYMDVDICITYINVLCLRDVNTAVMELLVMAYTLKTSSAQNIIGVIPYFPYRKRGSIVCKLLASMLAEAGTSRGLFSVWLVCIGCRLLFQCYIMRWSRRFCSESSTCVCLHTGLTHIITMDLHQKEIQGFFSFPVDNLRASPFLIQYIQEEVRFH